MLTEEAKRLKAEGRLKAADIDTAEAIEVVNSDEIIELEEPTDYESMKMKELRVIAKKRGISAPFGTKKAELIEMLKQ